MHDATLKDQYCGKTVLITGHTGFKGAWLALFLRSLGAKVIGYALPPSTQPNLFDIAKISDDITHIEGNILDYPHLEKVIVEHRPDIVFHLAAQAIVLEGYNNPKETFDTNAGGTVNVLEALRCSKTTSACVVVTTDKCYENLHWSWGYRENDRLGGHDPYSASKSMAELAVDAYRSSYFSKESPSLLLASVRAGNIIGGGDFSLHRIVPDCIRALQSGEDIIIRNPHSARPWLHVLDALYGYLLLGSSLLQGDKSKANAWNFGPLEIRAVTVLELTKQAIKLWGKGSWKSLTHNQAEREMPFLRLSWEKAAHELNWAPSFNFETAIAQTINWYSAYQNQQEMRQFCLDQIKSYSTGNSHAIYSYAS